MTTPENPPAFPRAGSGTRVSIENDGMTLRDWFASQALIGLLSSKYDGGNVTGMAYRIADNMLRAREAEVDPNESRLTWDDIDRLNRG